jgi:hypothetical protein
MEEVNDQVPNYVKLCCCGKSVNEKGSKTIRKRSLDVDFQKILNGIKDYLLDERTSTSRVRITTAFWM